MKYRLLALLFSLSVATGVAQLANEHLAIGETAPLITGKDQFGEQIDSEQILKEQQILLLFYRGNWCPYCRKHLKSLQDNLEKLTIKGYKVIVVTPEKVEKTKETTSMLSVDFSIVHDDDNKIMNAYKVAFDVNSENVANYLKFTQKKVKEYNEMNNDVLPVPATYIIGKGGKISFVHYDPDYKQRFDIRKILSM